MPTGRDRANKLGTVFLAVSEMTRLICRRQMGLPRVFLCTGCWYGGFLFLPLSHCIPSPLCAYTGNGTF